MKKEWKELYTQSLSEWWVYFVTTIGVLIPLNVVFVILSLLLKHAAKVHNTYWVVPGTNPSGFNILWQGSLGLSAIILVVALGVHPRIIFGLLEKDIKDYKQGKYWTPRGKKAFKK